MKSRTKIHKAEQKMPLRDNHRDQANREDSYKEG